MDLKVLGYYFVDKIFLAQDRNQWRTLVKIVNQSGFVKDRGRFDHLGNY